MSIEQWNQLTGLVNPTTSVDVMMGGRRLINAGLIKCSAKSKQAVARELQGLFEVTSDPTQTASALGAAATKKAGLNYAREILKYGAEPSQDSEPEPKHGKKEKPTDFVLLYRKLRHHPYFVGKPIWVKLFFIHSILDAAFSDHTMVWRGFDVFLKRGQWVLSLNTDCVEYGIDESTFRYWLKDLADKGMVSSERLEFSKKSAPNAFPNGVPNGVPARCTLITIINYNKFQRSKAKEPRMAFPNGLPNGLPNNIDAEEGISVKGSPEKGKQGKLGGALEEEQKPEQPSAPKLTNHQIFEIWNQECAPLPQVAIYDDPKILGSVSTLVQYFNRFGHDDRGAVEHFKDFVHKCRAVHPDHYGFICPQWFGRDLDNVNKLLRGIFNKPFSGAANAKRTKKLIGDSRGSVGAHNGSWGLKTSAS